MKTTPIRSTIILGALFGLLVNPMTDGLRYVVSGKIAFFLTLWLFLCVYSLFLVRRANVSFSRALFPLTIPLFPIFLGGHSRLLFILIPAILAWIRTGICFPKPVFRKIVLEAVLSAGGVLLVAGFSPSSAIGWALGIWLFFLVQSVYFIIGEPVKEDIQIEPDIFEKNSRHVEEILTQLEKSPL